MALGQSMPFDANGPIQLSTLSQIQPPIICSQRTQRKTQEEMKANPSSIPDCLTA